MNYTLYTLQICDEAGQVLARRHARLNLNAHNEEEYLLGRLAKEIYRDAVYFKNHSPVNQKSQ
jgi:hypothetical protein